MNEKQWQLLQTDSKQIDSNLEIFEDIKNGVYDVDKTSGRYFEYVTIRLFLAMENYDSIVYQMKLDEKNEFLPKSGAGAGQIDCFACYDDFDLVIEPTLRPTYGSADHFSHIQENAIPKQIGIVIVENIKKVPALLWDMFKDYSDEKLCMLCEADFLFKLLKDQPNAFSKFKEFLTESERIWRDETDYKIIEKKIITLIRQE
jgi:hypothetical protein